MMTNVTGSPDPPYPYQSSFTMTVVNGIAHAAAYIWLNIFNI